MLQTNYIAQQIFFEQQNLDKMEECECVCGRGGGALKKTEDACEGFYFEILFSINIIYFVSK